MLPSYHWGMLSQSHEQRLNLQPQTANSVIELAVRIDAALPQTQCTRCGYPDCSAYAQAIASGNAAINQCPPGGFEGVERLAAITGQPALPLNPENGAEGPRALAVIDEQWCIGCTLCIKACPTDAIIGANKRMHTVIEAHCTGCELCIPVCPVDCISLVNDSGAATGWAAWTGAQAAHARQRYARHQARHTRAASTPAPARAASAAAPSPSPLTASAQPSEASTSEVPGAMNAKQAMIAAAMARARAKRTQES